MHSDAHVHTPTRTQKSLLYPLFPILDTSSLTELGIPHRAFLQTRQVLEQTLRTEPIKTPVAWVRRHGAGGWIDGAERPVWAMNDFLYLSSHFLLTPPPFFGLHCRVDSLSLPRCPREPLIAPLALSALPPCHRMPIAVGTL